MMESHNEADEVFQEVWFRVIKKIDSYHHKNFGGWLIRIAHNIVIDRARRKKHNISLDQERVEGKSLANVIPDVGLSAIDKIEASAIGKSIEKAVAELPIDQKEVFILRVKSNLSFKEIAKIQKVSINTALARMQYALTKLRSSLKKDYETLNGEEGK